MGWRNRFTLESFYFMHAQVTVSVNPSQEFQLDTSSLSPMAQDAARRWLDNEFIRLECEPLRASGKLLLADKVGTVAQAAGPAQLSEPDWFQQFALATQAALGKPIVRIDLQSLTISY